MVTYMFRIIPVLLAILVLAFTSPSHARPKYLFKVASLAPEGSVWINHFKEFAEEVSERSNGEVGIKIYPGGVMGDDLAMYRKIRAGQLHGGGFTMTGISSVVPDFRVMSIPFYFDNYSEVDRVKERLLPHFAKKFNESGLELIGMSEVGFIYAMSTSPASTIEDLKKSKSWIPSGDPVSATFLKTLGISPIPLSIPDVLSSLQTGLIDTAYNSLYGTIVMQWFTKAIYIVDSPYGYAYGAIALSKKQFSKLPAKYAELIHEAAAKHFPALLLDTRQSNHESRAVLEEHGVKFIAATPESILELQEARDKTIEKLLGSSFSKEIFDEMTDVMKEIRQ
jgi:TRAP-type C4-dicarboxylate transport system substrate-binding protein